MHVKIHYNKAILLEYLYYLCMYVYPSNVYNYTIVRKVCGFLTMTIRSTCYFKSMCIITAVMKTSTGCVDLCLFSCKSISEVKQCCCGWRGSRTSSSHRCSVEIGHWTMDIFCRLSTLIYSICHTGTGLGNCNAVTYGTKHSIQVCASNFRCFEKNQKWLWWSGVCILLDRKCMCMPFYLLTCSSVLKMDVCCDCGQLHNHVQVHSVILIICLAEYSLPVITILRA